ncbi:phage head-tail joining protein [Rhodovulum tesquicola]|uniref:phage head-tail joining protein n=1 Tax=Rhodovulum tesquicola TaxID=540254 RepID=UPI003F49D6F6
MRGCFTPSRGRRGALEERRRPFGEPPVKLGNAAGKKWVRLQLFVTSRVIIRSFLEDVRPLPLPVLQSVDSNGESVSYKSDSEMARALAAIDAEIESMHRRPASRILPQTSKGL